MPRTEREKSVTGVYHIMIRGVNHQRIFEDEDDYLRFIETIRYTIQQYHPEPPMGKAEPNCGKLQPIADENTDSSSGDVSPCPTLTLGQVPGTCPRPCCQIYAYCVMDNHVHLLIQELDETISRTMHRLEVSYTYYYNHKYERDGHLFRGRFRSEPVNDLDYFVTLLRYIHQNPVKGGLVQHVEDYPYSSWHEFCNYQSFDQQVPRCVPLSQGNPGTGTRYLSQGVRVCNVEAVMKRISFDDLAMLVHENLPEEFNALEGEEGCRKRLSDNDSLESMKRHSGCSSIAEFQRLDKRHQVKCFVKMMRDGASSRQMERLSAISKSTIMRWIADASCDPGKLYLVACYKSPQQKLWIETTHCYNVRVDNSDATLRPHYLILYDASQVESYLVYKLFPSVKIVSRNQLADLGYPNPHSDRYMLYKIIDQVTAIDIAMPELLKDYNRKSAYGTPLYLSGETLQLFEKLD